jgi:hypothetical protein
VGEHTKVTTSKSRPKSSTPFRVPSTIASAIRWTSWADDPLPCNKKTTETGAVDRRIGKDEKTWTFSPAMTASSLEIDWDMQCT